MNLRTVHKLLLSLNIALALATAVIRGDGVFVPFVKVAGLVNQQLGRKFMNAAGGYVAYFAFVTVITALCVFALRLFRRTTVEKAILVFGGGILAVGLAPSCWFYITKWHGWYPVEVLAAVLCTVLYLGQKWVVPTPGAVLLAAIHFGFWGFRYWAYTHNPAELLISVAGFLSCLVWGANVRSQ